MVASDEQRTAGRLGSEEAASAAGSGGGQVDRKDQCGEVLRLLVTAVLGDIQVGR